MAFGGILNGNFVVWHENIAQIDIELTPSLPSFNKMDVILGINKTNNDPQIKIYYKASSTGSYLYLTQLTATAPSIIPTDGSFVEATYSANFPARNVVDVRIIITKDGIEPQELTPVKKYAIYNNGTMIVGGSQQMVNDLGWQTGEVFRTIFKYLEEPISATHTVDLATETSGLLPEARISDDNLLARVANEELITGAWSFEEGQIIIESDNVLPTNTPIKAGRLFYNKSDTFMYVGDGLWWVRLIQEDELSYKPDFVWGFTRAALVSPGGFLMFGNTPLSLTEGMPIAGICKLTTAVARVSTAIYDGSSLQVLKNGVSVYELAIENGTKEGHSDNIDVTINFNDIISVRASPNNVSHLNFPRLTLLFRSV